MIGIAGSSQSREYLVEHTQVDPADKAIIDRLVRTVSHRCSAPAQSSLKMQFFQNQHFWPFAFLDKSTGIQMVKAVSIA